jgi:hypothetical protein
MLKIWPQNSSQENSKEIMIDNSKRNIIIKSSTCKKQIKQSRFTAHTFDAIFDHNDNLVRKKFQ